MSLYCTVFLVMPVSADGLGIYRPIFKIGLVDDLHSDTAAATAARLDFGRSAALADGVWQHRGCGCSTSKLEIHLY